jgi:hypothetical protein
MYRINLNFHTDTQKQRKKSFFCLLAFLFLCLPANAQSPFRHEWGFYFGGGLSPLLQSEAVEKPDAGGIAGTAGISYAAFFSSWCGVETGLEAVYYAKTFTADRTLQESLAATPPGLQGNFYLRNEYSGYEEQQRACLLQTPLRLVFRIPVGKQTVYTSGGFKLAFPLSTSKNISAQTLTTTAYSAYTGQTYANMPEHGFETQAYINRPGKTEIKTLFLLSMESGIRWQSKNITSLGVFFDYGKTTEQMQALTFGLKLKFSWGSGAIK